MQITSVNDLLIELCLSQSLFFSGSTNEVFLQKFTKQVKSTFLVCAQFLSSAVFAPNYLELKDQTPFSPRLHSEDF